MTYGPSTFYDETWTLRVASDRMEQQWSPASLPHGLSFLQNVPKKLVAKRTHANYDLCTEKVTSQWHGGRGERYSG